MRKRANSDEHVVADITFVPGTNDGAAVCSCGEWAGAPVDFAHHRKMAVGGESKLRRPAMFRGERTIFETKAVLW